MLVLVRKFFFALFTTLLVLTTTVNVYANTPDFNQIVFLGDSLTDDGNLYKISEGMIPKTPPYFQGRFSNGLVWADLVSKYYSDSLQISSKNYAIGGETVLPQDFPPFTLTQSINDYLIENAIVDKSKTLFIVWVGANDYLAPLRSDADQLTTSVIQTMRDSIDNLILIGAKNILVMNLPDLSKSPYNHDSQAPKNLGIATTLHNSKLSLAIAQISTNHPDVNIHLFDVNHLLTDMMNNIHAYNDKYHAHISNLTQACWTGDFTMSMDQATDSRYTMIYRSIKGSPALAEAYRVGRSPQPTMCAHPDEYIFWDRVHPTGEVHRIFAELMKEYISENYSHS